MKFPPDLIKCMDDLATIFRNERVLAHALEPKNAIDKKKQFETYAREKERIFEQMHGILRKI